MLSLMAMGARLMARHRGRLAYWLKDDLVGANPEELAEPAHLGYLRHPASTLPEVDRLGLDADPQCQFKLGPSLVLAECPDRLHGLPHFTLKNYNRITIGKQLNYLL
jgi:hypothetical protein